MNNAIQFEADLIADFTDALEAIPGVRTVEMHLNGRDGETQYDGLADVLVRQKTYTLLLEVKRQLFPRDIPNLIWRLKRSARNITKGDEPLCVILGDTISPGARSYLESEGIGYYDRSGSLYLPAGDAFIYVERPATRKQAKALTSVFEGRKALVPAALWEAQTWTSVKDIAERIEASASLVSDTLSQLEQMDWVESQGQGPSKTRRLKNWDALLDAWGNYERNRGKLAVQYLYVPGKPADIARQLHQACARHDVKYELTGEFAGNRYTPHLTKVSTLRCRMPDVRVRNVLLSEIEARPVPEGWNLCVLDVIPGQEMTFRNHIDDLWFADPLRTYLDLLRAGGRAEELGKYLREHTLYLS